MFRIVLKIVVFVFGLSLVVVVTQGDDSDVIDLQDLLRNVSGVIKGFHQVLSRHIQTERKPRDCADLWHSKVRRNGIYRIWPELWNLVGSFEVYCDMEADGGGWTVFQKRGDYGLPRDYFFKTWIEYKNGFGDLDKEFWLGNDRIFALTNQNTYELLINLWDLENNTVHAMYSKFWTENEDQQYRIRLDQYTGNAGDSMSGYSGMKFTTKDRRNDIRTDGHNCADLYKGAWWYDLCHQANLNGLNLRGHHESYADGIEWKKWKGYHYSLGRTEMKIRPLHFRAGR